MKREEILSELSCLKKYLDGNRFDHTDIESWLDQFLFRLRKVKVEKEEFMD